MACRVRSFPANRLFQVRIDDFVSEDVAVPGGISRGSIIGPLIFPVIVIYLHHDLQLFCWMFAECTELRSRNGHVSSIQSDLDRFVVLTDHSCMILNAAKRPHFHVRRKLWYNLVFVVPDGIPVPIPRAHCAIGSWDSSWYVTKSTSSSSVLSNDLPLISSLISIASCFTLNFLCRLAPCQNYVAGSEDP